MLLSSFEREKFETSRWIAQSERSGQWYIQEQNVTIPTSLFKTKQSQELLGVSTFAKYECQCPIAQLNPIYEDQTTPNGICFTQNHDKLWMSVCDGLT